LEIEMREPVVRLVLRNGNGRALALSQERSVSLEPKVTTAKDRVNMTRNFARTDNWVNSFGRDDVLYSHEPVRIYGARECSQQREGLHEETSH